MPKLLYRAKLPHPDDPEIIDGIQRGIRKGHSLATASVFAGISHDAATSWYARGCQELATHPGAPLEELGSCAVFAVAVKEAEAEMVEAKLTIVERDMAPEGKGWLPAMTLLERRRPQDFGRGPRVTVDARQQTVHISLPPGAEHHVLDLLRSRLEAGRPLLPEGTATVQAEEVKDG